MAASSRPCSDETIAKLDEVLPPTWSKANPIDIIGDAPPDRYAAALDILAKDPDSDGLLVILTPQAMTDPTKTARAAHPVHRRCQEAHPGQLDGR